MNHVKLIRRNHNSLYYVLRGKGTILIILDME